MAYLRFPFREANLSLGLSIILVYVVIRINVYPTLVSGWASNRKYATIGSLRAIAQTISYEVRLALIFLFFLVMLQSLSLVEISQNNTAWSKIFLFAPLVGIWLISCIAETNRTPFDFAEGESELVSGFNVEYGATGFALIFIAEYASILFIAYFFVSFFISTTIRGYSAYFFGVGLLFLWVWVRTTLPRYRFDLLINIAWKLFLPISLFILMYACRGLL